MKILVLDDQKIQTHAPAAWLADPVDYREVIFTQFRRVQSFLDSLYADEFDEVWMDHDLGLTLTETGKTATYKILEKYNFDRILPKSTNFVLISNNPAGRQAMLSDLEAVPGIVANIHPMTFMYDLGISRGESIFL